MSSLDLSVNSSFPDKLDSIWARSGSPAALENAMSAFLASLRASKTQTSREH